MFDDLEPIFEYTTDQAIEDGVLIHFDKITPGKWCVTVGIWSAIEDKCRGQTRTPAQALSNLMSDALAFIRANGRKVVEQAKEGLPLFCDDFAKYMEGNITGETLWIGGNETGGFTIMFPHER